MTSLKILVEMSSEVQKIYRIGSKWYFRACPELPGRRFHYRAYCLDDLNGTMPRHSEPSSSQTAVERSDDQTQQSVVDRSSGTRSCQLSMNNASLWEDSANNNVDTTIHLVDIGTPETSILQPTSASVNQPQQQPSPKPVVSESTLDLLSEVDFTAPSNLLDINEPYLSAEPLVPIRSTQTSSFGSRAQSTTIGDNKNAANTMNNSTMTTSNSQQNVDKTPLESAATADSESFASLSGFCLVHNIPTESYSKPCPSNLASSKQQQQPSSTHDSLSLSDGETLVLISTPPSSVKISDVNTTQNEKNINNTQQRLDIVQSAALTNSTLSSNANEFDDTLTSDSLPQLQLCKKYDVFDEEKASKMYFEVISKPKQTLEEELIGGFEDEHEHYFDTSETIQHQFGSVVSHDGTRTSPTTKNVPNGKSDADIVAPTLKTSSKAVDSDQSKSTSTTEESQGDVHFVKTNESLAEVLHRLTAAGDHPQNSSQPRLSKSSEQIEGESSDYDVDDDTVRCNSERSLYAIRVPRRADDNEVGLFRMCMFRSKPTGV
ncbi:unnamed protein product [Anisakis simplex]|uniref:Rab-GAP TBC domain-containing protein n=1 Tax=Anisakis simplex TaxID=6269 RepID=A0A0M3J160_ANISI|nr:unnamed protein product [Anisakis simplex]